jgi:hypothetical protein
MKIYVAGGGGKSVATAAEAVGRAIALKGRFTPAVEDVAPTSAADPSGTVEFYAVIFLSIGASLGATAFGYIMGKVRRPGTFLLRTLTLSGYSALLAGVVTVYADAMLGALPGHPWAVFGVWGAAGCLLAALATASRVNYGALRERIAEPVRSVLRPRHLSPAGRHAVGAGADVG